MLSRWVRRRFDKGLHPARLSRVLRRLDLASQTTRPLHPTGDEKARQPAQMGRRDALRVAPELNPVERVWLFRRDRFLSHRLLAGNDATLSACREAWNADARAPSIPLGVPLSCEGQFIGPAESLG